MPGTRVPSCSLPLGSCHPKGPLLRRTLSPSPSPQHLNLNFPLCYVLSRRRQCPPHRVAVEKRVHLRCSAQDLTQSVLGCCLPLRIKWFNSLPLRLQLLVGKGLPQYVGPGDHVTAAGQSLWKNSTRTVLVCARKVGRLCYHPRGSYKHSDQGFSLTSNRNLGISVWMKEREGHLLKTFYNPVTSHSFGFLSQLSPQSA